jgi:hypothetical protein
VGLEEIDQVLLQLVGERGYYLSAFRIFSVALPDRLMETLASRDMIMYRLGMLLMGTLRRVILTVPNCTEVKINMAVVALALIIP